MSINPKHLLVLVTHLKGQTQDGSRVEIKAAKGIGIAFLDLDPAAAGIDLKSGKISDEQFDEMLARVGLQRKLTTGTITLPSFAQLLFSSKNASTSRKFIGATNRKSTFEISQRTKIPEAETKSHLEALQSHGAIDKGDGGWRVCDWTKLQAVASSTTAGK